METRKRNNDYITFFNFIANSRKLNSFGKLLIFSDRLIKDLNIVMKKHFEINFWLRLIIPTIIFILAEIFHWKPWTPWNMIFLWLIIRNENAISSITERLDKAKIPEVTEKDYEDFDEEERDNPKPSILTRIKNYLMSDVN